MNYRIAVVDDNPYQLREICAAVQNWARKHEHALSVSGFTNALEVDSLCYDAYLLDIDMPGMGGIEFAKSLRSEGNQCCIIFVSAMESAVFEAMRLLPLRFVRKSHFHEDLEEAMEALMDEICRASEACVTLYRQGGTERVPVRDILYVHSMDKYQRIALSGRVLEVRLTMSELEKELSPHGFLRVHRYYLVNMSCVRRLFGYEITLDNGEKLPVSRNKVEEVRRGLGKVVMRL